jgi:hypothetical protein
MTKLSQNLPFSQFFRRKYFQSYITFGPRSHWPRVRDVSMSSLGKFPWRWAFEASCAFSSSKEASNSANRNESDLWSQFNETISAEIYGLNLIWSKFSLYVIMTFKHIKIHCPLYSDIFFCRQSSPNQIPHDLKKWVRHMWLFTTYCARIKAPLSKRSDVGCTGTPFWLRQFNPLRVLCCWVLNT